MLLVIPLAPVLGGLLGADGLGRAIGTIASAFLPEAYYGASVARHGLLFALLLIPALAAGGVAGQVVRRWPRSTGIAIALGCIVSWSWREPSLGPVALLAVSGSVVVAFLLVGGHGREALLTAAVLVVASLTASAWWAIGAVTWAVFAWANAASAGQLRRRAAILLVVAAVQLALGVTLMVKTATRITPNYEWEPRPRPVFEVIHQPFEDPEGEH